MRAKIWVWSSALIVLTLVCAWFYFQPKLQDPLFDDPAYDEKVVMKGRERTPVSLRKGTSDGSFVVVFPDGKTRNHIAYVRTAIEWRGLFEESEAGARVYLVTSP
jgi:hypothetical protein